MRIACASVLSSLFFATQALAQGAVPAVPAVHSSSAPSPTVPETGGAPAASAAAQAPATPPSSSDLHLDLTTLKTLRARGTITQAEYDTAMRDLNETTGAATASEAPTFALGKFSTTIYGMVKGDFIYDSTQSFSDLAGNAQVQRPSGAPLAPPPASQNYYAGEHPRTQFSIHDSRLGFFMRAPETSSGVRVSGLLEMDLFGQIASNATEQQFYDSSVPRVRHAFFRVETPVVDVLVGQYWHLFGWQNLYHPASVQAQGLAGELYARDMQLRISKRLESHAVTFEVAVAALRPPSRDSAIPQGEAGLRLALNQWTGVMTNGSAGTSLQPMSIAVTGNTREITVPELSLEPVNVVSRGMQSLAVDVFIPVIPTRDIHRGNALSIHGEFVNGNGIADLYTSLTGGISFPSVPNTTNLNPAPTYPQDIDNGLVMFDSKGNLHAINWNSVLAGLQYYFPFTDGRLFLVANYAHMQSSNIADFTTNYHGISPDPNALDFTSSATVRKSIDLLDFDLFADVTRGVRIGVEYAQYFDHYVDGTLAKNTRVQGAGLFIF
jgi:hypothetical protein